MTTTRAFDIALRAGLAARNDTVSSSGAFQIGPDVFDRAGQLPVNASIGDTAITSQDSGREYVFNGNGWYKIDP